MMSFKSIIKSLLNNIKEFIFDFKELHAVFFGCLLSIQLMAFNGTTPTSIFDVMSHKEVLQVTLETDIEKLKSDVTNDEYQPAFLSFKDASGVEQAWNLKVKLRGKFRRLNCVDVPPLKLNFSKSDLKMAGLAKFDDMKLVPQCVEDRLEAEDLLKREYMAYRLFNELTPYSFRVQLLRITYVDSGTGKRRKQWAFLIEDTAQLRDRIGAEKCDDCYNMPPEAYHQHATRMVSVFQYMIGNNDWSLSKMRNVKLLRVKDKIVPIPYDFDFSGLVNARYAAPDPTLGITMRRDRVYLGWKEDMEELNSTLHIVAANQEKLERLVSDAKFMDYETRSDIKGYLNSFLGNPEIKKFPPETVVEKTLAPAEVDR